MTPKKLGDLLREVRENLSPRTSIPDLAVRLKVNRNTLGAYELGKGKLPDPEFLAKFAQVTGCGLGELIAARLAVSGYGRELTSAWLGANQAERPYGARQSPREGFVYLPLKEVEAAAGGGSLIDSERVVDVLAFREEWIRQELHARPDDLDLIYVKGDSMEPDLRAGDIILLDHTDTRASREGVYVIQMDGALLVKQLQRLPGGVVKVISRNAAYESFTVTVASIEDPNGFAVIGRVVWACRRF